MYVYSVKFFLNQQEIFQYLPQEILAITFQKQIKVH